MEPSILAPALKEIAAGRLPEAVRLLDELYWSEEATSPELLRMMASLQLRLENHEAAAFWTFELLSAFPTDAGALDFLAREVSVRLRGDEAGRFLERFPASWPDHPAVVGLLARHAAEESRKRAAVSRSKALRRKGDYDKARKVATAALDPELADDRLLNELGQVAFEQGDLDLAQQWFSRSHEVNPKDRYATNNLGKLALRRGQRQMARQWYRKTLEHHPDDPFALSALGYDSLAGRDLAAARRWFEAALAAKPDDGAARRGLARVTENEAVAAAVSESKRLRRERDYPRAERLLLKVAARHDNPVAVLVELGLVAHGDRRYQDARTLFAMAYHKEPGNPLVLNMMGAMELTSRNPSAAEMKRAREWFDRALEKAPRDCRTLDNIGWLELRRGNLDEAVALFDRILQLDPDNHRACRGKGEVALRRGQYGLAQHWWDKAWWEGGREDAPLLAGLAKTAIAQGDFATGRKLLEGLVSSDPEDYYALTSLAYLNLLEGRLEEAAAWLKRAERKAGSQDERILNLRGKLAQKQGEHELARQLYSQTLQIAPGNTYAMAGLGWTAYGQRRWDEASFWFGRALERDPSNPHALTGMGLALARQGEFGSAEECYRSSLESRFHPPAIWHWFRTATISGSSQQLGWFLRRTLERGSLERWVKDELVAWEDRLGRLVKLQRDGEDPWPYLRQVGSELPPIYAANPREEQEAGALA